MEGSIVIRYEISDRYWKAASMPCLKLHSGIILHLHPITMCPSLLTTQPAHANVPYSGSGSIFQIMSKQPVCHSARHSGG